MLENSTEFIASGNIFHGSISRIMGTRLEIIVSGSAKDAVMPVWNWLCIEAGRLDSMLNRFDPESELSKANASGGSGSVSTLLKALIMTADEYKHRTGGLFDISKGDRELDFGGFAKGYLLKELKSVLPQGGIKSAFVDFGGSSILAAGRHPYGDCWKVGVRDPFSGGVVREIELKDQSMSTSGNSPGYSGHIINPATGMQVEGRKMVTVISEDPLEAEVLSTAAMVAGAEALHRLELAFPDSKFICFEEDSMR